jgi:predicted RNA-binding Zn ribbon-like protein
MIDVSGAAALESLHERLCLDFANTSGEHPSQPEDEFLSSYANLVEWSVYSNVLHQAEGEHLLALAEQHPVEAEAALHYAVAVRETIYRVLSAAADGHEPEIADMQAFNHILVKATRHLRLAATIDEFDWAWVMEDDDLEKMLWPVIWSASQLLMSHDRPYLRECASDDCDWLFLDTSKNHSRRWCRMKNCGNRAKARAHYHRSRDEKSLN